MATNPLLASLMRPPHVEGMQPRIPPTVPEFFSPNQEFWNHAAPGFEPPGMHHLPKRTPAAVASNPALTSPTLTYLQQPLPSGQVHLAEIAVNGRPRRPILSPDDPLEILNREKYSLPAVVDIDMGIDLTTLGLNLNANHNLYKTLPSPWHVDEASRTIVAMSESAVPSSFLETPKLRPDHVRSMPLDTLFYCYHNLPLGDPMHTASSDQLVAKGWELKEGKWSKDGGTWDPIEWK